MLWASGERGTGTPADSPVRRRHGLERAFTVAEWVNGTVIRDRDDLAALTDDRLHDLLDAMISTLVNLHVVDPAAAGLADFGRPNSFLARQVRCGRGSGRRCALVTSRPGHPSVLGWRITCRPAPGRRSFTGTTGSTTSLVGQAGEVLAVVDWELSTLGDPFTEHVPGLVELG